MSATAETQPIPTLVVDDATTFVQTLQDQFLRTGSGPTTLATSVSEARVYLLDGKCHWQRIVSDLVFEREREDGIDFLEAARVRYPNSELILLTGKPVDDTQRQRMARCRIRLLRKATISGNLMKALVRGAREIAFPLDDQTGESDVGEVILKWEALRGRLEEVSNLNDLLIEDIVSELDEIPDQANPMMLMDGRRLAPAELRNEVLMKSPIGLRVIKLHHQLYKMLRDK